MSKKKVYKKIHKKINGQVIHVNKRWCDLKQSQKEFICNAYANEYKEFIKSNDRLPNKDEKLKIVDNIYDLVQQKNINIPYGEVKKAVQSQTMRLNKKYNPLP